MMETPFFSIVIPVYNVEKYIKQCLNSILAQTFENYEIILVDDGSTDTSGVICDAYAAKTQKITVIHKVNGGLSDARNAGTAIAKGTYVIYVDSDDFLSGKNFLKNAHELLISQDEKIDLLVFGYCKFYENGRREKILMNCDTPNYLGTVTDLCRMGCFQISAWGKIVRRFVLEEHKIQFRVGVYSEDMEWCAKLLALCEICGVINQYAYVYRQRAGSITKSWTERNVVDIENNFRQCLKVKSECIADRQEAFDNYLSQNIMMFMIILSTLDTNKWDKYVPFIKENAICLKYSVRSREKITWLAVRLLGIKNTERLLGILYQKKQKSRLRKINARL